MNYYCGTDIIEVDRIKKAITSTSGFKEKIFTTSEISYAEGKSEVTKYMHYAGRFAAKEAVYKAVSKIYAHISLSEIEILNDKDNLNRPYVVFHNEEFKKIVSSYNFSIDVSISHIKEVACANCVVNFE